MAPPAGADHERIVALETRIAYQDKTIADLDEVVREFADRVLRLERAVAELKASVGAEPLGDPDEPPPHY